MVPAGRNSYARVPLLSSSPSAKLRALFPLRPASYKHMRLTIFGSGYVGLVTGACFAEVGNNVLCVDVDQRKVEMLKRGESPIYEPGLDELLKKNIAAGRLTFTTSAEEGVKHGLFQFIAVGTPP